MLDFLCCVVIPGTLKNHFLMDGHGETTIFHVLDFFSW